MDVTTLTAEWAEKHNITCLTFKTIGSTNDYAKSDTQDTALILAEHQTAGRGRKQRLWEDEGQGRSLLASFCFWQEGNSPQPILAPLLGLALIQSLESHFSGDFSLKAPNDVYLGGRKLAGILIEMIQTGPRTKIIIGLGLNVLALRHDHPERAALVNLTEVDEDFAKQWSGFLDQLYQAWTELSTQPPTMIAANECQALLIRLRKNQHHQGLSAVSANGSLQTTDGQWIHWENL